MNACREIVLLACALWGSTVACGGGDSGPNRGSQCSQLLNAACVRLGGACQVFPANQVASCVQSGMPACCAGNCSTGVISTQQEIDVCVADINAATCANLDITHGGMFPTSCMGVVRSALVSGPSPAPSGSGSIGERMGGLVAR
jgi:hypothetical protein